MFVFLALFSIKSSHCNKQRQSHALASRQISCKLNTRNGKSHLKKDFVCCGQSVSQSVRQSSAHLQLVHWFLSSEDTGGGGDDGGISCGSSVRGGNTTKVSEEEGEKEERVWYGLVGIEHSIAKGSRVKKYVMFAEALASPFLAALGCWNAARFKQWHYTIVTSSYPLALVSLTDLTRSAQGDTTCC